jgi:hypothetical protein
VRADTGQRAHTGTRQRGRLAPQTLKLADQRTQLPDPSVKLPADTIHHVSHPGASIEAPRQTGRAVMSATPGHERHAGSRAPGARRRRASNASYVPTRRGTA